MSSSCAVREATIGSYSVPRPPRSCKTWSSYSTGSPMVIGVFVRDFNLRIYSIMESDPFRVVWNTSLSCIIFALDEVEKIFFSAVHATWDVWCPIICPMSLG